MFSYYLDILLVLLFEKLRIQLKLLSLCSKHVLDFTQEYAFSKSHITSLYHMLYYKKYRKNVEKIMLLARQRKECFYLSVGSSQVTEGNAWLSSRQVLTVLAPTHFTSHLSHDTAEKESQSSLGTGIPGPLTFLAEKNFRIKGNCQSRQFVLNQIYLERCSRREREEYEFKRTLTFPELKKSQ